MDALLTVGAGSTVGQVGMTLAAIAYANGPATIASLLANPALATQGRWQLAWYASDAGNQVYVALDQQSGQYAVAIRGSATDPFTPAFWIDWFDQDLGVFRQVDWPYGGAPAGASISQGALHGLGSLLSLQDANNNTLVDFFRTIAKPKWLTAIVGHSLGGALATVLAPYLQQELSADQNLGMWPVTFAAPTAGNGAFAGWLEQQFAASIGRYYNSLDVVPHAWAELAWIAASFPNGPSLPLALKPPVDAIRDFLKLTHADYHQPGSGNVLNGTIAPNVDWFGEAGTQHASTAYLSLVGAPPLPP